MVGAFGADSHLLQRQADLSPDIFTLIRRGNIHIARLIIGNLCGLSVFIPAEQVKFHFRAEGKGQTRRLRVRHGPFQKTACVRLDLRTVRPGHGAEHPHHPAMLRAPRQNAQCRWVRVQQQIGVDLPAEARNGGTVNGDAIPERPVQLAGHDGDIFLTSLHIAEGHADKLNVLLRRVLANFLRGILHTAPPNAF